jgi:hypothetical protein
MVFHGIYKGLAFFDDISDLTGVKMDQGAIVCLLPILEEPVVMLAPLGIELFGSDKISMQRRADLVVGSKGLLTPQKH